MSVVVVVVVVVDFSLTVDKISEAATRVDVVDVRQRRRARRSEV